MKNSQTNTAQESSESFNVNLCMALLSSSGHINEKKLQPIKLK
jgi:hypothetical protein